MSKFKDLIYKELKEWITYTPKEEQTTKDCINEIDPLFESKDTSLQIGSVCRYIYNPTKVGKIIEFKTINNRPFCKIQCPISNLNPFSGLVVHNGDFTWKAESVPLDQLEIASEQQLLDNIKVYSDLTRKAREIGHMSQEEGMNLLNQAKKQIIEISKNY